MHGLFLATHVLSSILATLHLPAVLRGLRVTADLLPPQLDSWTRLGSIVIFIAAGAAHTSREARHVSGSPMHRDHLFLNVEAMESTVRYCIRLLHRGSFFKDFEISPSWFR